MLAVRCKVSCPICAHCLHVYTYHSLGPYVLGWLASCRLQAWFRLGRWCLATGRQAKHTVERLNQCDRRRQTEESADRISHQSREGDRNEGQQKHRMQIGVEPRQLAREEINCLAGLDCLCGLRLDCRRAHAL